MKLKRYLNEKKAKMTGDQFKDSFIKQLNQWDTDLSKLTKAYKSVKPANRMDFYEANRDKPGGGYSLKKGYQKMPEYKKFMKIKQAFETFKGNFDKWIYSKVLTNKNVKDETLGQDDVRKTAWNFIIDMETYQMFPEEYEYDLEKHIPAPWAVTEANKKKYISKYQRAWRKFKEAFEFLVEYGSDRLEQKEDEQVQVAGVNVAIKNKKKEDEKEVKKFLNSLKKLSAQIKKEGMGKALQGLNVNLNFDIYSTDVASQHGDLVGGTYSPSKDEMNIFPLGIGSNKLKMDDSTFIHELGHRYWFRYVPERAKKAWEDKINSRMIKVKGEHIDKFFDEFYDDESDSFPYRKDFKKEIDKIDDPTLKTVFGYLSTRTPLFDVKDGRNKKQVYKEHMNRHAKGEDVPLEWISDYGRTNPVEAFAEAFKLWIGGSKGKLGEWTRAWFKNIVSKGGVNIKEELMEKYL